jgi:hypothetical protein
MRIRPITLRAANAYVEQMHRHHKPVRGCCFCVAVEADDGLHGVAIAGRPVARMLQDGRTLEVTRLCTDGARNACSMLYRAVWRAAREMGYTRLVTYTLASEHGSSLKASGFRLMAETDGGSWSRPSRARVDKHPTEPKKRWEVSI